MNSDMSGTLPATPSSLPRGAWDKGGKEVRKGLQQRCPNTPTTPAAEVRSQKRPATTPISVGGVHSKTRCLGGTPLVARTPQASREVKESTPGSRLRNGTQWDFRAAVRTQHSSVPEIEGYYPAIPGMHFIFISPLPYTTKLLCNNDARSSYKHFPSQCY